MSRIFSLANDASITSMRCSQFHSPSRPSPITSCFKTPKTETARGFRGDFTNQWRHSGYVHLFFFFFLLSVPVTGGIKCANVKEPFKYSVHVVTYGRCPVIIAWNVRFENGFWTGGDYVAVMWLPTGTKPDSSAACATTYPALLIHPWPRSRILLRAARTGTWRDGEEKAEQTDRWAETVWQTAAHGREQVLNSPTVKSLQCCIIIILPKCCKDGRCALLLHEA